LFARLVVDSGSLSFSLSLSLSLSLFLSLSFVRAVPILFRLFSSLQQHDLIRNYDIKEVTLLDNQRDQLIKETRKELKFGNAIALLGQAQTITGTRGDDETLTLGCELYVILSERLFFFHDSCLLSQC
jgi:hypothetical protein